MKFHLIIVILTTSTMFVGCGVQSGGLAPSKYNDVTSITDVSAESSIKYGESVILTNGWKMSIDTTDPVEEVTLVSGWSVEVKYE